MAVKLLITDFDGTLVDTYYSNLRAYQEAFTEVGLSLSAEQYRARFGFRFDRLMTSLGIYEEFVINKIRDKKKEVYPKYFKFIRPNIILIDIIRFVKSCGAKIALASTARRDNLLNVVRFLELEDCFDLILAGEDVKEGKPSPEIYLTAMNMLKVSPEDTIIFEDSEVGIQAAKAAGAKCMIIDSRQFSICNED